MYVNRHCSYANRHSQARGSVGKQKNYRPYNGGKNRHVEQKPADENDVIQFLMFLNIMQQANGSRSSS